MNHLKTYPDVFVSPWPKNNRTIAELTDYMERCLPPTCTALEKQNLQTSADGNFRIVWFLLDDWKKGNLSLKKIPAKPLTLPAYYKDCRKNRILKKSQDLVLCRDVATILATARMPVSASVITNTVLPVSAPKIDVFHLVVLSFLQGGCYIYV